MQINIHLPIQIFIFFFNVIDELNMELQIDEIRLSPPTSFVPF